MRKYQQLLLLIVSCISIGVLFMYKTENKRLKDVLHAINFFGRKDAAILKKIDNATVPYLVDYSYPLAVWQRIGDQFHGYSAFWKRNELVAGGEAVVIVVGLKGAVLNFKCTLNFKGSSNQIQGKFRFQRMDKDGDDDNSEFTRYQFYCRVTRDFGNPESVTLYDATSKSKGHSLKLRYIKVVDHASKKLFVQPLTVCVDMVSGEFKNMTTEERQSTELLEFFAHHYVLGVEDFVIYNGDSVPQDLLPLLRRLNLRLHLVPFNFPFSTQNSTERIRDLIETDCLLRSTNRGDNSLLLAPNEFFYPSTKLYTRRSFIRSLIHYSNSVHRFVLPVFAICKNEKHKYLFENTLYDPEFKQSHDVSICRPLGSGMSSSGEDITMPSRIALGLSQVFTHRYVNCVQMGKDGLHDWRNSLREDFMQYIKGVNEDTKVLI